MEGPCRYCAGYHRSGDCDDYRAKEKYHRQEEKEAMERRINAAEAIEKKTLQLLTFTVEKIISATGNDAMLESLIMSVSDEIDKVWGEGLVKQGFDERFGIREVKQVNINVARKNA